MSGTGGAQAGLDVCRGPGRRGRLTAGVRVMRGWLRMVVVAPMILYSKAISPALPRRCKYEPTCSAYAVEAVRRFGALRGLVLAAWRVLRCNPLSDGGYDPVAEQRLFRQDRDAQT